MKNQDEAINNALENVEVPPATQEFFASLQDALDQEPQPSTASPFETPTAKRHARRIIGASSISVAAVAIVVALIAGSNDGGIAPPQTGTSLAQPTVTKPTETTEIQTLLASQVVEKMTTAIADVKTLSATVQVVQHPYSISVDGKEMLPGYTIEGKMYLRSDGSSKVDYTHGYVEGHGPQIEAYNAKTGVSEMCWESDGKWSCSPYKGAITPVIWTFQDSLGLQTFSSVVRNLVADDSSVVETTEYGGRPAWKFHAKLPETDINYTDEATVYVDQETAFPLRVEMKDGGKPYSETTLSDVKVNPPLNDSDFTLTRPKGAQVNEAFDWGYSRTSIDQLQSLLDYKPIVPAALPEGFELAEVSYAKALGASGPEGSNQENNDVAVITYRRGLQFVTFTTRRTPLTEFENDPFAGEFDPVVTKKTVTLSSGSFAGTSVVVTTSSRDQRLWGKGSKLILAVAGDLTADEMLAAANSLHQYGG